MEFDAGTRPFVSFDVPSSYLRRRRERRACVCVCVYLHVWCVTWNIQYIYVQTFPICVLVFCGRLYHPYVALLLRWTSYCIISKCWEDWDLGLCTTAGHAFGEPLRSGEFWGRKFWRRKSQKTIFCHCAAVLQSQVPKLCTVKWRLLLLLLRKK